MATLSGFEKPDRSIVSGRHPASNSQLWLCVVDVSTHDDHGQLSGKTTIVVLENHVCSLGRRQASGECGEPLPQGPGRRSRQNAMGTSGPGALFLALMRSALPFQPFFSSYPHTVSNHAYAPLRRDFSLLRILRTSMVASPKGDAQSRVRVLSTTGNDQLIDLQAIRVATSLVHSSSSSLPLPQVTC